MGRIPKRRRGRHELGWRRRRKPTFPVQVVQEPKRRDELDFFPGAFHQADEVAEISEIAVAR